ncbi:unnamed protein product [Cyprideis torosa]|uniref:Coiled-coil domain-containing protein 43 n=1 Tax=Cyprideis torosa TaxID=163714 RepID=A0A7R8ZK62_9CRUS|nr:unnamed protein product [Cyprideis torosa]CAG0879600.1 unnamed protein product [Cyprideis torosa]
MLESSTFNFPSLVQRYLDTDDRINNSNHIRGTKQETGRRERLCLIIYRASVMDADDDFRDWMLKSLRDLGTDDEMMTSYVLGILEGEGESPEEQLEALQDLLEEICPGGQGKTLAAEILSKYKQNVEKQEQLSKSTDASSTALGDELSRLLHVHHEELLHHAQEERARESTNASDKEEQERRKLKEAILMQYSEVAEGGDSESEESEAGGAGGGEPVGGCGDINSALEKLDNAGAVAAEERRRREEQKKEAEKKKDKDKADREKQKAQALERKEKEKKRTQKGERRARSSVLAVTMPVYVRDIRVCEDAVTMEYDETDMVKIRLLDSVVNKLLKAVQSKRSNEVQQILDELYAEVVGAREPLSSDASPLPCVCTRKNILATLFGIDHRSRNLLHVAAKKQDLNTFQVLLDAGADINQLDGNGFTPLAKLLQSGLNIDADFDDFVLSLLKRNARVNGTPRLPIVEAIRTQDLESLQVLLEHGANPNAVPSLGEISTPLWQAIKAYYRPWNKEILVKKLLDFGADPTVPSVGTSFCVRTVSDTYKFLENPCRLAFCQELLSSDYLLPAHVIRDLFRTSILQDLIPHAKRIVKGLVLFQDYNHLVLFLQSGILFYLQTDRKRLSNTLFPILDIMEFEELARQQKLTKFLKNISPTNIPSPSDIVRFYHEIDIEVTEDEVKHWYFDPKELRSFVNSTERLLQKLLELGGKLIKSLKDFSPSCSIRFYKKLPKAARDRVMSLEHLACRRVRQACFLSFDPPVIAEKLVGILPPPLYRQVMGIWIEDLKKKSSVLAVTMPVYKRNIRVCGEMVTMEYDERDMVKLRRLESVGQELLAYVQTMNWCRVELILDTFYREVVEARGERFVFCRQE